MNKKFLACFYLSTAAIVLGLISPSFSTGSNNSSKLESDSLGNNHLELWGEFSHDFGHCQTAQQDYSSDVEQKLAESTDNFYLSSNSLQQFIGNSIDNVKAEKVQDNNLHICPHN